MAVDDSEPEEQLNKADNYPEVADEFDFNGQRPYKIAETVIDRAMDVYNGEHESNAVTDYLNQIFESLDVEPEIRVSEASRTEEGSLLATQTDVPYELDVDPEYEEQFVIFEDTGYSEGGVDQGELRGFFDVEGVE